jgi:hypothetical protein
MGSERAAYWSQRAAEELADHDARRISLAARLTALDLVTVPPAWAVPGNTAPTE